MMKKMNKKSIMAIVFAAMFVFASVAGIFLPKQASAVGKRGNPFCESNFGQEADSRQDI